MREAVGFGNVGISNYVRDKGWGMSSLVGAIPSLIGGQQVTLTHIGKVFRITPENLERFREWWKYNSFRAVLHLGHRMFLWPSIARHADN